MYTGAITMRYAKALLAYANEAKVEYALYQQALTLERSFREVPELRTAIDNPVVSMEEKLKVLTIASGGKVVHELERFFRLVMQQRREKYLSAMIRNYIDLYRKQENISIGKLTTAVPMALKEVERIRKIIVDHKGGSAEFTTKVDPDIEGGFIFEIGTYRLDASVANQMRRIKQQFIEKNRRIV